MSKLFWSFVFYVSIFQYANASDNAVSAASADNSGICVDSIREVASLIGLHVKFLDREKLSYEIVSKEFSQSVIKNYYEALDPYQVIAFDDEYQRSLNRADEVSDMWRRDEVRCEFFEDVFKQIRTALERHIQTMRATFKDVAGVQAEVEKMITDWDTEAFAAERQDLGSRPPRSTEELSRKAKMLLAIEVRRMQKIGEPIDSAMRGGLRLISRFRADYPFHEEKSLYLAMSKAILDSLDRHTVLFPPVKYMDFMDSMRAGFAGLGVEVQAVEKGVKITKLFADGPAARQGVLQEGDVIVAIEGNSEAPLDDMSRVVVALKGDEGTVVHIDILRNNEIIKNVAVTRGLVMTQGETVVSHVVEKNGHKYGYLKTMEFYSASSRDAHDGMTDAVIEHLKKMEAQGIEGLILDLRGNPGGDVLEAQRLVGVFIPKGSVARVRGPVVTHDYSDDENTYLFDKPLAVMVNYNSASASEIVSGSLQDYNRAIIVGAEHTYGKGSGQSIFPLDSRDGSGPLDGGIKITTFYYFLPSGRSIQYTGVQSDFLIPSEEKKKEEDQKFEKDRNPTLTRPNPIENKIGTDGSQYWMPEKEKQARFENVRMKVDVSDPEQDPEDVAYEVLRYWGEIQQVRQQFDLNLIRN